MPIKSEDLCRYPPDWSSRIRPAILERGGNRCEGSPRWPDCRAENGKPHPVTGSRVVLTIAHLDHTPEHCEPANLRAWCQRCHLAYDAPLHAAHSAQTQAIKRALKRIAAQADMFHSDEELRTILAAHRRSA